MTTQLFNFQTKKINFMSFKKKNQFIKRISLVYLSIIILASSSLNAQTVTPWLTNGNGSVLLEQQGTISFSGNSASTSNTITINQNVVSQSVAGYGFCLTQGSAEVINSLTSAKRVELLDELFGSNGLGISALRISIGASDLSSSVYSYNETSGDTNMNNFSLSGPDLTHLLPLLQDILAINPDIKILATPWTAPTWMKDNGTWIGGSLLPSYYTAYSLYFTKYLEAMQSNGINIWAVTPQNEPENPFNEPSMLMTAAEQIDFINNHLGPAIQAAGFNTKIIAFDHNCDNTSYPIQVLNNSSYAEGAAFHLYAGDISAMSTVRNSTGKDVYFTEQFTSSNGNFNGDFSWHIRNIVIGASNNWSKTVFEWNLASDSNHDPHTPGGCTDCLGALTINGINSYTKNVSYYIIGQISKFVAPNAQKIEAVSNNSKILTTAFKNTDGSVVVIAYNNNNNNRTIRVIDGAEAFDYTLPKKSAVSFIWTGSTTNPTAPSAPSNLVASDLSESSIQLNWTDNSNNETSFEVQRSPDGVTGWQTIALPSSNSNAYVDNSLTPSTTYYYRVRATNAVGNSGWSNIDNATTQDVNTGGGISGIFNVIAEHSDKGLDVANQSNKVNANVQQWEIINGGGDNQRWEFTENNDGTYQLKAVHSGKCLAIRGSNNSNVVQKNCDGNAQQQWEITSVGNDYHSVINFASGEALEVQNASTTNGANVKTGNYFGNTNQRWRFNPISSSNFQAPNSTTWSNNLMVFPNPVDGVLNIKLPNSEEGDVEILCFDLYGRILLAKQMMVDDGISIPVVDLPEGIYFLKVKNNKGLIGTKRFVVKR